MSERDAKQDRREVIKLLGTSAAALPVLGLVGCGGGSDSGGGSTASEVAADAAEAIEKTANDAAEMASDAASAVEQGASDAIDAAADMADDAANTAADMADDAANAAADMADSVADEAQSVMDKAEQAVGDAMDAAEQRVEDAAGAVGEMVDGNKLDENSAQATSLGYKHDATAVDSGAQPRYAAGQACANCQLFQGGSAAWGACPIFAGNLVKSTGWCSAYVAKG
ncbi:MAG: high-potential iron-sulfur protein [Pseudomonadota bacterium]